jgi:hypothetical protein
MTRQASILGWPARQCQVSSSYTGIGREDPRACVVSVHRRQWRWLLPEETHRESEDGIIALGSAQAQYLELGNWEFASSYIGRKFLLKELGFWDCVWS